MPPTIPHSSLLIPPSFYRRRGKRWLDVALAAPALLLALPLLAGAAAVAAAGLAAAGAGGGWLFSQRRPGRGGRLFTLYKIQTMTDGRDPAGHLLPDAARLRPWGRWLRRTSLDELPQLWNVLRGDLSLVGPRPLLPAYLPRYSPTQGRRHEVRPGLTGWAQVHGRNALSWEEKFVLDVWYVDNLGFWLDVRILGRTVGRVLGGGGTGVAEEFLGQDECPQVPPGLAYAAPEPSQRPRSTTQAALGGTRPDLPT